MGEDMTVCAGIHSGAGCTDDEAGGRCGQPTTIVQTLVGGPFDVPPTDVPKCDRCAAHWRAYHPERIAEERAS